MQIEDLRTKEEKPTIQIGDLVFYDGEIGIIVEDEEGEYPYLFVNLTLSQVSEGFYDLDVVQSLCELVAPYPQLKLVIEKDR